MTHEMAQFDPLASDGERASKMVMTLENTVAFREQRNIADVRPMIARRIKTTTGTLLHIRKQRRKIVPSWLMNAIREELVSVLQSEVARLEHEIHIHRQVAGSHRGDHLAEAEAQVVEAKKTLRLAVK